MRYKINFDKTINQLTPHYLSGRKLILYLQAIMKPLQMVNDRFSEWARDTRIEASMISQVIHFEWFLYKKFGKYFLDNSDRIAITDNRRSGPYLYNEDANVPDSSHLTFYYESEGIDKPILYHKHEEMSGMNCSFTVSTPQINTHIITEQEYISMLKHIVDKYRLAGKTYSIQFN